MSVLQNKRLPYWNYSAGFDFDHITVIRMIICTKVPNFIHIGPSNAEIWRHVDFSIWRPRRLNTTSGFLLVDYTVFGSSKYINKPNYRRHISFHGWDITTSDLQKKKQTSAILEFYFRFRFPLYHRNWHAILHQADEFHRNGTTYCGPSRARLCSVKNLRNQSTSDFVHLGRLSCVPIFTVNGTGTAKFCTEKKRMSQLYIRIYDQRRSHQVRFGGAKSAR